MDQFEIKFWLAIVGAAIVKVMISPWHSLFRAIITIASAVFSAWLFTDPAVHYLGIDPGSYRNAMAGLIALLGESLMRWLLTLSPEKIINMVRGRGQL